MADSKHFAAARMIAEDLGLPESLITTKTGESKDACPFTTLTIDNASSVTTTFNSLKDEVSVRFTSTCGKSSVRSSLGKLRERAGYKKAIIGLKAAAYAAKKIAEKHDNLYAEFDRTLAPVRSKIKTVKRHIAGTYTATVTFSDGEQVEFVLLKGDILGVTCRLYVQGMIANGSKLAKAIAKLPKDLTIVSDWSINLRGKDAGVLFTTITDAARSLRACFTPQKAVCIQKKKNTPWLPSWSTHAFQTKELRIVDDWKIYSY
jgi:hypothetical protein